MLTGLIWLDLEILEISFWRWLGNGPPFFVYLSNKKVQQTKFTALAEMGVNNE